MEENREIGLDYDELENVLLEKCQKDGEDMTSETLKLNVAYTIYVSFVMMPFI